MDQKIGVILTEQYSERYLTNSTAYSLILTLSFLLQLLLFYSPSTGMNEIKKN